MSSLVENLEIGLLSYLKEQNILFERFEHAPLATMEQARARPGVHGEMTKNLLLKARDDSRFYLVVMTHEGRLDIGELQAKLGVRKLSFASVEELFELLGITPGSVTLLGLRNDLEKRVTLVIDSMLWEAAETQHHPLVNTSTVVLSRADLRRFLSLIDHEPTVINIPVR